MAVVERRNKSGIVYSVVNEWNGKQVRERVGTVRRDAEIRDRAMKAEIKAGTYHPKMGGAAVTVWSFAKLWSEERTNVGAKEERRQLRLYLENRWLANRPIREVTPVDVDKHAEELRREVKPDGSRRLADKTVANFFDTLKQVFKAAMRRGLCSMNPVMLEKKISRAPKSEREIYMPAEAVVLFRHHAIPHPVRVLNALCLLGGLREGEACGRRWRDVTEAALLPAMDVRTQYNDLPLKTKRPRVVPVHPELQKVLLEWATGGFELYVGRKPEPDDFIVPNRQYRALSPCWARTTYYKAFIAAAREAGVRPRTLHATRHTFITLCRRGGAPRDIVERITHNSRGGIVDRYTHFDWEPLCKAVLCLDLTVRQAALRDSGIGGEPRAFLARASRAIPGETEKDAAFIQGLSPELQGFSWLSRCLASEPSKSTRSVFEGDGGESPARATASADLSEEAFRAAVVEHGARAAVSKLLAKPLRKVRAPVPKRSSRRAGR